MKYETYPMITEVPQTERTAPLLASLLAVWEDSVRATHDFLSEADIQSRSHLIIKSDLSLENI
jgi:hypothetical protein